MTLTNRNLDVSRVVAETGTRNRQRGSSHQRAGQRGNAVNFQDVFDAGVDAREEEPSESG